MTLNLTHQWPSPPFFKKKNTKKLNKVYKNNVHKKKLIKIEKFFSNKLGFKAKLFPSGRSCIGLIFKYLNLNKKSYVFLSKWSSNSLISSIGHYCNITDDINKADVIIANNQWGKITKIKTKKKIIIDDSSDSIILNKKSLFPNRSKFEFFSLPKIIGSFSGGIIISKNKDFLKFCEKEQKTNVIFGKKQFKCKISITQNEYLSKTNFWHNEVFNTFCPTESLIDIEKKLKLYDYNKDIIIKRLNFLKKSMKINISNRIGPVLILPINYFKNINSLKKNLIIRHSITGINMKNYEKSFLLPLHFKIDSNKLKKIFPIIFKDLKYIKYK